MQDGIPILFLARQFPPTAGGGVQRASKLCKYLPAEGVLPSVLCAPAAGLQDDSLLADVSAEVRVERLAIGFGQRTRLLAQWAHLGRLYKWLSLYLLLSDEGVQDLAETTALGVDLGRKCEAKAVLATSLPFSSVVAGALVARTLDVPFIADLRDPWAHAPRTRAASRWHRMLMQRAETAALEQAAAIIIVTEQMRRYLPPSVADTATVIPNGFDPEDMMVIAEPRAEDTFRVVYVGSLYGARSPDVWLEAMLRLAPVVQARGKRLEIVFAGQGHEHAPKLEQAEVAVELRGYMPHMEAVALIKSADVITVLIGTEEADAHAGSAKLYEAIAAGPSVVAWARKDGEAARVLEQTKAGHAAETLEGLVAAYEAVLDGQGAPPLDERHALLEPYSRVEIARRFAVLIRSALPDD